VLEHKSDHISETRKDRGKVTVEGRQELTNVHSNGAIPTSYTASSSPRLGVCNPRPKPKTPIAIISGTGEATDFKFGQNIYRVNRNKSPLKFWRKGSVGVSMDCPNFWDTPIISGMGEATDFKFGTGRYI